MSGINWFPGHMVKARRDASETLARADVVVEVLDARLPGASSNPMITSLREHRQRPALVVLNKADLADPPVTAAWRVALSKRPRTLVVALSCKRPGDVARIVPLAASLAPHRDGPLKPLRLMVMGIPNVGKSTLINALVKRNVTRVGDQPAVTRQQSRHDIGPATEVIDTPGLMWPAIEHESDGYLLAASHAIGENAYIDEAVATFLAGVLLERYPDRLAERYGCKPETLDPEGVIDAIAQRRGFRLSGGRVDRDKAALTLVHDYRAGALGRISLESPDSRTAMMAAAQAAKAAASAAREAEASARAAGEEGA
jgi:ribosome biogenesis GTPase A